MTDVAQSVPIDLPKQVREPARRVGNFLATISVLVGVLLAVVQPFIDFVPGEYHGQVSAGIAAAAAAVAILTRLSAELIRGKVTPYAVYQAQTEKLLHDKPINTDAPAAAPSFPPPDIKLP